MGRGEEPLLVGFFKEIHVISLQNIVFIFLAQQVKTMNLETDPIVLFL